VSAQVNTTTEAAVETTMSPTTVAPDVTTEETQTTQGSCVTINVRILLICDNYLEQIVDMYVSVFVHPPFG